MAARRKQITFSKPKPLTVRGVVSAFLELPEGWGGMPRRLRVRLGVLAAFVELARSSGKARGTSETLPRDVAFPPRGPGGGHLRLLPVAGCDDAQEGEDQVDAGRRAGR